MYFSTDNICTEDNFTVCMYFRESVSGVGRADEGKGVVAHWV